MIVIEYGVRWGDSPEVDTEPAFSKATAEALADRNPQWDPVVVERMVITGAWHDSDLVLYAPNE